MRKIHSDTLLDAVIAIGASGRRFMNGTYHTFQAHGVTSAGAGAATIKIQVSDVAVPSVDGHWMDAGTITLTLSTTRSTDGFTLNAAWRWVRANVTAISGTNATVSALIGT